MKTLVSRFTSVFAMIVACGAVTAANAQTPVATYQFNGNLAATQAGVSALTATDPQGTSGFGTASVFGVNHGVYNFVGNTTPLQQAGLSLNTTGLLTQNYSIEMVFKFTDRDGAWRRIIDVQNRQSDKASTLNPAIIYMYSPSRAVQPLTRTTCSTTWSSRTTAPPRRATWMGRWRSPPPRRS